ncbi:MAG: ABC transporter ATP-binding protein [Candidatus Nanopelagicales bacterium]
MVSLLRRFLRPYGRALTVVIVLVFLQAMANLFLPTLNADIINNGVVKGDIRYIITIGAVMLAVTFGLGICSVVAVYYSARTAMGFGRDVRASMFGRVQEFSLHEVNEFGTPSLITRNTNDVQQVQMLVLMGLTMLVLAPITAIGGIVMAVRLNVQLSGLLLVIIPLMAVVIGLLMVRAVPLFRSMQVKIDRINEVLRENLAGIRVIRAFVRTEHEQKRFAVANDDLTDTSLRVARLFALMMPILMLVMNGSSVAIIWFGGHLINTGDMQIGDLTAFLQYITQILFAVMMAVMMFVMVPRAAASAERIQAVLTTQPAIHDPSNPVPLPTTVNALTTEVDSVAGTHSADAGSATGRIEFRDVEFRYPGAQDPVLERINFTLEPGRTTAIVGGTGSGKTTLINLIPRLYDVSGGAIMLDGVDIRDLKQADLWSQLALVPQKAFLFSGTVASNVRFGNAHASDEQVWHALRVAQAEPFVSALAEQLDSPIDQGGANVSGGQRQRLAIARALVRKAPFLILDDSFSALDYATDARLRAALRKEETGATVLIVAQRVSTILHADKIIVLDQGLVVGMGTHAELMDTCPTYLEIVSSQLSVEEAA